MFSLGMLPVVFGWFLYFMLVSMPMLVLQPHWPPRSLSQMLLGPAHWPCHFPSHLMPEAPRRCLQPCLLACGEGGLALGDQPLPLASVDEWAPQSPHPPGEQPWGTFCTIPQRFPVELSPRGNLFMEDFSL